MAGVQREARDSRPADPGAVSTGWWRLLLALSVAVSGGRALGREAGPDDLRPPPVAQSTAAPEPAASTGGDVPDDATAHDDDPAPAPSDPIEPPSAEPPSLEPAKLAPASQERSVTPLKPVTEPTAVETDSTDADEPPEPTPTTADTFIPRQSAALALKLLEGTLRALPRRLAASAMARSAHPEVSPSVVDSAPSPQPKLASPTASSRASTVAEAAASEPRTVDIDALDAIRLEIKSRLPYFQACADASRRRGGSEIRRLQAVWSVTADGSIKALKLENVDDPQLALCITRMGSRPFAVKPGADLTIPTPIVFVR